MAKVSEFYSHHDGNQGASNVVVEVLIWDSLLIQACSVLDHMLRFAGAKGSSLESRISYSKLSNEAKTESHRIRKLRNRVGHDPQDLFRNPIDTATNARDAIALVRNAASELQFQINLDSIFEFFAERVQDEGPYPEGIMVVFNHKYGAKKDGEIFIECSWKRSIHNRSS